MNIFENYPYKPYEPKISKWTRFKLFFAKKYIGRDTEGGITSVMEFKKLKDVIYCTHSWVYKDGHLIEEEKL